MKAHSKVITSTNGMCQMGISYIFTDFLKYPHLNIKWKHRRIVGSIAPALQGFHMERLDESSSVTP